MIFDRETTYDQDDFILEKETPSLNLPDIEATQCFRLWNNPNYLILSCKPSQKYSGGCPACGSVDIVSHGKADEPRQVHDVNIGLKRVDLIVDIPRYRCKDCGAVFRHIFDSIPEGKRYTYRLYEQIRRDAFIRPFSQVAAEFGISEGTVRSIFDEYATELEAKRGPIVAPEVLGIDEKHIVHAMRGIFVDIKTGRLLEMTEDNKESSIIGTIERMVDYDKNIRIVTTDMANSYRSYIHVCLPNAKVIVDKYHVYQDLYVKVRAARKLILEHLGNQIAQETDVERAEKLKTVRNIVVYNAYLFKFGKEKLAESESRISAMAQVCETFPEFNHLRLIKEGFERIYEQKNRQDAEAAYESWCSLIPPRGSRQTERWEKEFGVNAALYADLATFYRTTQKWYKEIFNYFDEDCQYTNAASEGTNSKIQRINSEGAGYGFRHLRAKALFFSHIGPRATYSLSTIKKAIYGYPTRLATGSGTGGKVFLGNEYVYGIHLDTAKPVKNPYQCDLSNSLYYDFEDDE